MFSKKSSTSQVARLHISLLIASFLIYLGGQIWQCVSWPPFYSFDETLEIDYVYQLSQGHLPTFFGGAEFNPLDLQYPYDVQWRYQHPPLFYLVQVPAFLLTDTLHHPSVVFGQCASSRRYLAYWQLSPHHGRHVKSSVNLSPSPQWYL